MNVDTTSGSPSQESNPPTHGPSTRGTTFKDKDATGLSLLQPLNNSSAHGFSRDDVHGACLFRDEASTSAHLDRESEDGNVEYKLKLVDPPPERFNHLVTQLQYRLSEGQGEAIYEIGVEDGGFPRGLSEEELAKSLGTLQRMAETIGAQCTVLCEKDGESGRVAEVLIRKLCDGQYMDLRVSVCGNVDSGKSTLVGVLTSGRPDNGRGLARTSIFNHKHELETGRTSSISQHIMGFDAHGNVANYSHSAVRQPTWVEIMEKSTKVVTFVDLAGHERYLKTTVFGMTAHLPDYSLLIIGANMGITRMTKEHLGLSLALKVPLFIVVTKIDICPPNVLQQTMDQVTKILKMPGIRKLPFLVRTNDDVLVCSKTIASERVVPVFQISSVTGENVDLLRRFLNLLSPRRDWEKLRSEPSEFLIDETFFVEGIGTIVAGTLTRGVVSTNDLMLLGPDSAGHFKPARIRSIQAKRVPVRTVMAGHNASFALKNARRATIRKGMVLVDSSSRPRASWEFEAEVVVLFHATTITKNYQPVVHCLTVRQSARIVEMDRELLRTGDKATVRFRFMFRPEYLREGVRLIFREGRTKGLGMVSRVFFENEIPPPIPLVSSTGPSTDEASTS